MDEGRVPELRHDAPGDALPASVIDEHKPEIWQRIEALERRFGRRASQEEKADIRRRCAGRVERHLDAGHGECLLRHPEAVEVMQRSFQMSHRGPYVLDAWCVMPNHAHAILTPAPGVLLEKITYDWKHGSARLINRALGRRGMVWQNESFDHLPRDEDSLKRFRGYVLANPAVGGLHDWEFVGIG